MVYNIRYIIILLFSSEPSEFSRYRSYKLCDQNVSRSGFMVFHRKTNGRKNDAGAGWSSSYNSGTRVGDVGYRHFANSFRGCGCRWVSVGVGGCARGRCRREGAGVAAGSLRIGRTAWPAAGSGVTFSRDADRVTSCWRRRDRPRRATRAVRCRNVAHSAWNGNRTDATWVRPTTVHTTVWRVGTATIGYPGKKIVCTSLTVFFIIIIVISYL